MNRQRERQEADKMRRRAAKHARHRQQRKPESRQGRKLQAKKWKDQEAAASDARWLWEQHRGREGQEQRAAQERERERELRKRCQQASLPTSPNTLPMSEAWEVYERR